MDTYLDELAPWEELNKLCDKFRRNDGRYDCIVPGSGGKDSAIAAHKLKYKYGMNPLLITWPPILYTEYGRENYSNWIDVGGFAGIWDLKKKLRSNELISIVKKMRDALISRGPDDKNIWLDKKNNFCVGHRRLSIIEISKLGLQPMISRNQRYVIAYNGEIYNYLDIKKKLSNLGVIFKSNCDTEILLEAISFWNAQC